MSIQLEFSENISLFLNFYYPNTLEMIVVVNIAQTREPDYWVQNSDVPVSQCLGKLFNFSVPWYYHTIGEW